MWWAQSCLMKMSMEIILLTKDRSSPQRKMWADVWDRCINSLSRYQSHLAWPRFHCGTSDIYHNPTKGTRKKESKNHSPAPSGPSSPQTKACVSMTTLRWDPLSAIDSSQSVLRAEGGSGDKERFNSICSVRLLAPHVNGICRLHSEPHRSEAQKRKSEGENYVVMVQSPFGPQRCDDNFLLFFHLSLCHFKFPSLKKLQEERKLHLHPLGVSSIW